MSTVKHVVIAAAGLGSRLGLGKPKCLVEILETPLIGHLLSLFDMIEDVRVVIGFEEELVIEYVTAVRRDVLFVRNPAFRSTTTLYSYALGARYLSEPALFLDADILFEPQSLKLFLDSCSKACPLIGITKSKTVDAVFAHLDSKNNLKRFSRTDISPYEWANIVFAPPAYFEEGDGAVFEHLKKDLPLPVHSVVSYEVDCPEDLIAARKFAEKESV